jgi:uncharacterized protein
MRNMEQKQIISKTASYVRKRLENDPTGHDWWHTLRVWNTARYIAKKEHADMFIVELAALLHDVADWKFHGGDETAGARVSRRLLQKLNVKKDVIDSVCDIIINVSFKGAVYKNRIKSKEGMVVQDADRLDATGAMGIARCFAFGGYLRRPIYDPSIKPKVNKTVEEYKKMNETSINHFYEKLLLLKGRMNTKTGKRIANSRHKFMENYLKEFFREWKGV